MKNCEQCGKSYKAVRLFTSVVYDPACNCEEQIKMARYYFEKSSDDIARIGKSLIGKSVIGQTSTQDKIYIIDSGCGQYFLNNNGDRNITWKTNKIAISKRATKLFNEIHKTNYVWKNLHFKHIKDIPDKLKKQIIANLYEVKEKEIK